MLAAGRKRIVVIGAGPVGLEAALYAAELGHDVRVFDKGAVGEAIRRWGFVRLFSPLALNVSPLGRRVTGGELPADDAYLTGAEYVERYLQPLAASRALHGSVTENQRVIRIGRTGIGKSDMDDRERHPFRMLVDGPGGEAHVEADVVLDCSGTYGHHNWVGDGNVPALGELSARRQIDYVLPDIPGAERDAFVGKHLLIVGGGFSAATALDWLVADEDAATRVEWVLHGSDPPYDRIADDPLPERARLAALGNALATGADARVRFRPATTVTAVVGHRGRLTATLECNGQTDTVEVSRILALVGYRPDTRIHRELQVQHCHVSEGPLALAATLTHTGTDCLQRPAAGPATLKTAEPGFFVLGAKSYGRNPHFLIRTGVDQVRSVFTLIEGDPGLDLYAAD